MTNPITRAQYDRDRLEYLYAHFRTSDLFPPTATVEEHKSQEDQIETYAAGLHAHISDPKQEKIVRILVRLSQTRGDLDEYKEVSKDVQELWAIFPNQIVRMGANALREVEICARADIEMLENDLGRLRGQLPPRNIDGPPGRIASGQYGSETGAQSKTNDPQAVNQRALSAPRSPTTCVPMPLRSASRLGFQLEHYSAVGDASMTVRSRSTTTVGSRVQNSWMDDEPGSNFYTSATSPDASKRQHDIERIIARAKRQSLDPEMLSALAIMKSDKLPNSIGKLAITALDPAAFPGYDPSIKQKKTTPKQYGDTLKKDGNSKHLANICETPELPKTLSEYQASTTVSASQSASRSEAGSSTIVSVHRPAGLGLVEYQERFGCRVIPEDVKEKIKEPVGGSKKTGPARQKFRRPWVIINDSVSMPAHLSSVRANPPLSNQPMNMIDIESPIDRPNRPFQRTSRGLLPAEFVSISMGTVKPAMSTASSGPVEQKGGDGFLIAHPTPRAPSQARDRDAIIQGIRAAVWEKAQMAKAAEEAEKDEGTALEQPKMGSEIKATEEAQKAKEVKEDENKKCDVAIPQPLDRSVSRSRIQDVAQTLMHMSRGDGETSDPQQPGPQNIGVKTQNVNLADSQEHVVQSVGAQHSDAYYGLPQYGSAQQNRLQYGGSQYGGTQQSETYYGGSQYGSTYTDRPQYGGPQQSGVQNSGTQYIGAQYGGTQPSDTYYGRSQHGIAHQDRPQYGSGPQPSNLAPGGSSPYIRTQRPTPIPLPGGRPYPIGPHGNPVVPTIYHRGFQQGYRTTGRRREPYVPCPYGAIGSEMKALKEKRAQEEKKVVAMAEQAVQEQSKAAAAAAAVEATEAGGFGPGGSSAHRRDNSNPFAGQKF